ncbi:MAG TPA: hypothetical protein VFX61_11655 [Micromonosporaceae bacterium]|nr:hypothetical protein [Micromonosporaceae bacterium]
MSDPTIPAAPASPHAFPCSGCGARVEYAPGTDVLRCPYCGSQQQVAAAPRQVREHPIEELAHLPRKPVGNLAPHALLCRQCGAQTQSDHLSDRCQFCGHPMVVSDAAIEQIIPEAVLPFAVDANGVRTALRHWVSSRWFAPGSLKKVTTAEQLRGTYLPHWTFDSRTTSRYRGQRGDYYWVTETYTVVLDGRTETRTRQVRKTRWSPASGTTQRDFDDVLVIATTQVPTEHLEALAPWPLQQAVPYQPAYLAGYQALRYDTEPEAGLATAKSRMERVILSDCRRDIGGDEQRVHSVNTSYFDVTFKLMLLPVWIACYLHAGKSFQVLVNGTTGEVHGERPYSAAKITMAIIAALIVIAAVAVLISYTK